MQTTIQKAPYAQSVIRAQNVAQSTVLYNGRVASYPIHVLIIGCGLGGLAAAHSLAKAGHRVTIIESAPAIGEVGAGIQVSPNVSRLLIRWGLGEALKQVAVLPEAIVFNRWCTGERVGKTVWGQKFTEKYNAPYYHIHRADFHQMLYDLATSLPNVTLRLGATVKTVSPTQPPSITLVGGETLSADLILGADGIKSVTREVIVGGPDSPVPTGDTAYRATVPTSKILDAADRIEKSGNKKLAEGLRGLIRTPEMTAWMGPQGHIMGYCIRAKGEYNMVLLRPDDGSVESWTAEGSAEKMRADFIGWEPRIQTLLSLIPSTLKWKLMDRPPLKTWVHPSSRIALLGDACHPMLPYRAQGAAMAIEDGAMLGTLFSYLAHPSQITPLLYAYEKLRHPRCTATQQSSTLNQKIFHLPDGPEQERRDNEMRSAMQKEQERLARAATGPVDEESVDNPNQWADQKKNKIQFMYDADAEAEKWWREVGEHEVGPLAKRGPAKL